MKHGTRVAIPNKLICVWRPQEVSLLQSLCGVAFMVSITAHQETITPRNFKEEKL